MLCEAWKAFTVALGVNETKSAELTLLFCFFLPQQQNHNKKYSFIYKKWRCWFFFLLPVFEVFPWRHANVKKEKKKAICIKNSASRSFKTNTS